MLDNARSSTGNSVRKSMFYQLSNLENKITEEISAYRKRSSKDSSQ